MKLNISAIKNMTQTKTQQLNPEIFTIWSDETEGRIDPFFYRLEFIQIEKDFRKLRYKKLKDIAEDIKNGSTLKGGIFESSGIPFFRSQDFKLFDFQVNQYVKKEFHKKLNRSAIKSGDVLLAVVGATLGVVGYVPDEILDGNINQNIARIRVKDKEINSKYLAIVLDSKYGQKQIHRLSTATTQAYLNNEQLGEIKIPLPPLSVQNKIVSIMQKAYEEKSQKEEEAKKLLDSVDDYVLGELGIKMPEIKKEMVFEVWSDKIENSRIDADYWQPFLEEVKEAISKGKYKTQKLKNFITKIHYGASTSNAYTDEGIPLLRIQNLKPNFLNISEVVHLPESFRKELGNAFVEAGDLLISRSGTVGVVSVVPKEADGFAFGSFMIKFCLNDKINKEFVSIWLNNKLNKLLTEREKIGAIQGNITISTIENFDIPLPSFLIQNKIAEGARFRREKAKKLQQEAKELINRAKKDVEEMVEGI